jgi:PAS domain S-box-containing protein
MLLVTVATGCVVFLAVDRVREPHLHALLEASLAAEVDRDAREIRARLDAYGETHELAATHLACAPRFIDYAASLQPPAPPVARGLGGGSPCWLPDAAELRRLSRLQYALLIDRNGVVREAYGPGRTPPPEQLLRQAPQLLVRCRGRACVTLVGGTPFLLAAATAAGKRGEPLATLLIATAFDGAFLASLQRAPVTGAVLAVVGPDGAVLASSRPDLAPPGSPAAALAPRHVSSSRLPFDEEAADPGLGFVYAVPRDALAGLSASLVRGQRRERLALSCLFVLASSLIVAWIGARVSQVARHVMRVSASTLGLPLAPAGGGDQIQALLGQFRLFTEEILANRERIGHQAAALLQEKTVYLDHVLSSTGQAIVAVDLSRRVKYANDAARELSPGANLEVGTLIHDAASEDVPLAQLFAEAERDASAGGGQPYTRTVELPGPEGARILAASVLRVFDRDQAPIGALLILRDETQRRHAEEAVKASEMKYRTLHQSLRDGYVLRDGKGAIIDFNESFRLMLGYGREELTGLTSEAITPEPWHRAEREILERQVFTRGYSDVYEKEYRRKDGTVLPVELRNFLLKDDAGRSTGTWALVRDISERKQTERDLQIKGSAIETALSGIAFADLPGKITYVNRAFLDLWGYATAGECVGRPVGDFWLQPEGSREVAAALWERGGWFGEMVARRKDGSIFIAQESASLVRDREGRPLCRMAAFVDVTERREAETRTRAALQEKEMLLREIHHRVKNNLQIIASLLYLQAEQVQEPHALKLLQESRDRIKSMALVHEKLFGARDLSRVDLAGYLQSLAGYLTHVHDAGRRGVKVAVDVDEVTLGIDLAAPCGLIVHELLSNALKYAFPEGRPGSISVAAARGADGTIALEVADDGVGLPAGLEAGGGATLGLRLVRQLVGQLRGTLAVSRSGGTRFHISFSEEARKDKEVNHGA